MSDGAPKIPGGKVNGAGIPPSAGFSAEDATSSFTPADEAQVSTQEASVCISDPSANQSLIAPPECGIQPLFRPSAPAPLDRKKTLAEIHREMHAKNFAKAAELCRAYLEQNSRDEEILKLDLKANHALLKRGAGDNETSSITADINRDNAMLVALHPESQGRRLENGNALELAQSFNALTNQKYPDQKDSDFVRDRLSNLAARAFATHSYRLNKAGDQKHATFFYAMMDLSLGNIDGGMEKLKSIRKEVPEADNILKKAEADHLRTINLAAVEAWETYNREGERIQKSNSAGVAGRLFGFADWAWRRDDGDIHQDQSMRWTLERDLVAEVKRRISSKRATTMLEALKQIAESGPQGLRKRARFYVNDGERETENMVQGHLIDYASKQPPDKAKGSILLQRTFELESRDGAVETPLAIYSLVASTSADAEIKKRADEGIAALQGNASFGRAAMKHIYGTSAEGLAIDVGVMFASAGVGNLAKLAMLRKLQKSGTTGYKAIAIARTIGGSVETAALGSINLGREALNGDAARVLTLENAAKVYGSTLVMIGCTKGASSLGNMAGTKLATRLGYVTEDFAKLTKPGKVLVSGIGHASGLGGMIASSEVSLALGLREAALGGWREILAGDVFMYVEFAIAHKAADQVLGGRMQRISQKQHTSIAVEEAQAKARSHADRMGFRATRGPDGKIVESQERQVVVGILTEASLNRVGFSGAKLAELVEGGSYHAAGKYLEKFNMPLEIDAKGEWFLKKMPAANAETQAEAPKAELAEPAERSAAPANARTRELESELLRADEARATQIRDELRSQGVETLTFESSGDQKTDATDAVAVQSLVLNLFKNNPDISGFVEVTNISQWLAENVMHAGQGNRLVLTARIERTSGRPVLIVDVADNGPGFSKSIEWSAVEEHTTAPRNGAGGHGLSGVIRAVIDKGGESNSITVETHRAADRQAPDLPDERVTWRHGEAAPAREELPRGASGTRIRVKYELALTDDGAGRSTANAADENPGPRAAEPAGAVADFPSQNILGVLDRIKADRAERDNEIIPTLTDRQTVVAKDAVNAVSTILPDGARMSDPDFNYCARASDKNPALLHVAAAYAEKGDVRAAQFLADRVAANGGARGKAARIAMSGTRIGSIEDRARSTDGKPEDLDVLAIYAQRGIKEAMGALHDIAISEENPAWADEARKRIGSLDLGTIERDGRRNPETKNDVTRCMRYAADAGRWDAIKLLDEMSRDPFYAQEAHEALGYVGHDAIAAAAARGDAAALKALKVLGEHDNIAAGLAYVRIKNALGKPGPSDVAAWPLDDVARMRAAAINAKGGDVAQIAARDLANIARNNAELRLAALDALEEAAKQNNLSGAIFQLTALAHEGIEGAAERYARVKDGNGDGHDGKGPGGKGPGGSGPSDPSPSPGHRPSWMRDPSAPRRPRGGNGNGTPPAGGTDDGPAVARVNDSANGAGAKVVDGAAKLAGGLGMPMMAAYWPIRLLMRMGLWPEDRGERTTAAKESPASAEPRTEERTTPVATAKRVVLEETPESAGLRTTAVIEAEGHIRDIDRNRPEKRGGLDYTIDRGIREASTFSETTQFGRIEDNIAELIAAKRAQGDTSPVRILTVGPGKGNMEADAKEGTDSNRGSLWQRLTHWAANPDPGKPDSLNMNFGIDPRKALAGLAHLLGLGEEGPAAEVPAETPVNVPTRAIGIEPDSDVITVGRGENASGHIGITDDRNVSRNEYTFTRDANGWRVRHNNPGINTLTIVQDRSGRSVELVPVEGGAREAVLAPGTYRIALRAKAIGHEVIPGTDASAPVKKTSDAAYDAATIGFVLPPHTEMREGAKSAAPAPSRTAKTVMLKAQPAQEAQRQPDMLTEVTMNGTRVPLKKAATALQFGPKPIMGGLKVDGGVNKPGMKGQYAVYLSPSGHWKIRQQSFDIPIGVEQDGETTILSPISTSKSGRIGKPPSHELKAGRAIIKTENDRVEIDIPRVPEARVRNTLVDAVPAGMIAPHDAPAPKPPRVLIQIGEVPPEEMPPHKSVMSIGRGADPDFTPYTRGRVQIEDPRVSKKHFELERNDGGGLTLTQQGTINGTRVKKFTADGKLIDEIELKPRDPKKGPDTAVLEPGYFYKIEIGDTFVGVNLFGEDAPSPVTPPPIPPHSPPPPSMKGEIDTREREVRTARTLVDGAAKMGSGFGRPADIFPEWKGTDEGDLRQLLQAYWQAEKRVYGTIKRCGRSSARLVRVLLSKGFDAFALPVTRKVDGRPDESEHWVAAVRIGGRDYIVSANEEQFGPRYDKLLFIPFDEAAANGIIMDGTLAEARGRITKFDRERPFAPAREEELQKIRREMQIAGGMPNTKPPVTKK